MTVLADLGLTGTRDLLHAEIEHGLQSGAVLSVSYRGEVVDVVAGDNGAGAPLAAETTVPWTCSSKPLGAIAFAAAWEAGAVDPETPVVEVLPEFTGGGKDLVRVRDLLAHTTGIPEPMASVDTAGADITSWDDVDALIWSTICAAGTTAEPGSAMIYNPVTNWFVLDRVLNALGGGAPGDSYRSLFERLGLSATLGADWTLPGERRVEVVAAPDQRAGLEAMQLASALPLPGVGVWGTVGDLRVVGEVLLGGGAPVIGPAAVEALTTTRWPGTPDRFVVDTDFAYGLGVMTGRLVMGRRCSDRVYGHAGGNTSTLLVDPTFDLVVAVYWNGRQNDVRTVGRRYALVRALYRDLGLDAVAAGEHTP